MERQDDASSPPKRLCQPVDIPPANIPIDHDAWDSTSFIADSYPDVMQDIESSLHDNGEDSAAALLGFDFELRGNDHHFSHLDSSSASSFRDIGSIGHADDFCMMEDELGDGQNEEENEVECRKEDRDKDTRRDELEEGTMGDFESGDEMIVIDEDDDDEDDPDGDDSTIDEDGAINEEQVSDKGGWLHQRESKTRREPRTSRLKHANSADDSISLPDDNPEDEGDEIDDDDDDDEVEEEEEGGEEWDSDSEGDLDALLDEGLPEEYKQAKGSGRSGGKERRKAGEVWRKVVTHGGALPEGLIGVKEKTVLKRHGQEPLEGLPDGWIRISHQCGMPLYLHRPTRVCSWSRPYLLGSGSARRHHIPVAAIPCLHYSRALERERRMQTDPELTDPNNSDKLPNGDVSVPQPATTADGADTDAGAEVQGQGSKANEDGSKDGGPAQKKSKIHICEDDSVDGKELHAYLSRLFEFDKIAIKRFKSWAARRKYTKAVKTKDRPQFPGGPKVIRCEIPGNKGREFVINAQDKTPVCILHEYSQRVMRTQPQYVFGESKNASAPFEAVVEIQGVKYGRGEATSKRLAKAEAAKATLDILVPELISDIKPKTQTDTEYFDHVAIDDSRIYDLCMKAGQLTPWQVLQEYRQRSHGMADTELKMNIKLKNHQRSEYTLTLGPHTVTGMCKNKTNGKQQGAQKLLKQLHPELSSWGAIIKMYGKGSSEINREKKEAEQSVTELTHDSPRARPNRKILNKLRMEMLKVYGEQGWLEEELQRQKEQGMEPDIDMDEEKCTANEPA